MSNWFTGLRESEPVVGDVYCLRQFQVRVMDGQQRLLGLTYPQEVVPGVNVAECQWLLCKRAPGVDCSCGFYSFDRKISWSAPSADVVTAVVRVSGKTVVCEGGVRSEEIEVVGFVAHRGVSPKVEEFLRGWGVRVSKSLKELLVEFPLASFSRGEVEDSGRVVSLPKASSALLWGVIAFGPWLFFALTEEAGTFGMAFLYTFVLFSGALASSLFAMNESLKPGNWLAVKVSDFINVAGVAVSTSWWFASVSGNGQYLGFFLSGWLWVGLSVLTIHRVRVLIGRDSSISSQNLFVGYFARGFIDVWLTVRRFTRGRDQLDYLPPVSR